MTKSRREAFSDGVSFVYLGIATGWMGENHFAAVPTALYGAVLLAAGIAYLVLEKAIVRLQGLLAFVHHWFSHAIDVLVALMWLVPDRRIERKLRD